MISETVKSPIEVVVPVLKLAFVHCQFMVPSQFAALNTTGSIEPWHTMVLDVVRIGVGGNEPSVIIIELLAGLIHCVPLVQVAVYVPGVETVMLVPVDPFDQVTVPGHPVEVRVEDTLPQTIVELAEITGIGEIELAVIVIILLFPL